MTASTGLTTWRVPALIRTTAVRESVRLDLALARAVYLTILVLFSLSAAYVFTRPFPMVPVGLGLFRSMLFSSTVLLLFLALRLPTDAVGDQKSGMLDLLKMSGTTTGIWLLTRVLQIWIGFLSVWLIRLPMLVLAWSLGGVLWQDLMNQELVLLLLFAILSSMAMLISHTAESRRQVSQQLFGTLFGIEWLLAIPKILLGIIPTYTGVILPGWTDQIADFLYRLRFSDKYQSLFTSSFSWNFAGNSLLLYSGIGLACLGGLWLAMFNPPADRPESAGKKLPLWQRLKMKSVTRRPSRRSWDDALAWQAFHVHGDGRKLLIVKMAVYLLLLVSLPTLVKLGYRELGIVGGLLFCGGGLFMAANKPGDCLQREIKEQTLPSLLLAPIDSTDLYLGWRNGAWKAIWPDLLMSPILIGLCLWMSAGGPPMSQEIAIVIPLTVALGILSGGPFMVLSPLVPFNGKGISTGLFLLFVCIAIAVLAGMITGIYQRPSLFPVLALPLWWLFNFWIKYRMLPHWLTTKVSSII